MINNIKLPIALEKDTDKLVNVKDVENGLKCNCYCKFCKEDLEAVNNVKNKRTAHFRHRAQSNCKSNYETYIHWLAKEVFKDLKHFKIPKIEINDIEDEDGAVLKSINANVKNLFKKYAVPFRAIRNFERIKLIKDIKEVEIDKCFIEKHFKTPLGDIIVDIVVESNGKIFFIEPYYTNPIDINKLMKIKSINYTTIAINLLGFNRNRGVNFTIEEFRDYLTNFTNIKEWKFIKKEAISILEKQYCNKVEQEIQKLKPQFNLIYQGVKQIKELEKEKDAKINILGKEIHELEKLLKSKRENISEISNSLTVQISQIDKNLDELIGQVNNLDSGTIL